MTLRERLKAVTNNFAWEQDWNIREYAEHKRDIEYRRGKAEAYGDVVHRLDEVLDEFPEEPVVKDKMTLRELARGLRKVLKFKYLTLEHTGYISLWKNRPKYSEDFTGSGKTWRRGDDHICGSCAYLFPNSIDVELNLEEYEDADGNIDYSKCIVEVSNDIK